MNRQEHFEVILARVRERQNLTVHDSEKPLNSDGTVFRGSYAVLHDLGPDQLGDQRYDAARGPDEGRAMRVVGRCVGVDPPAARRVASALIQQLAGWTPVVTGRSCWPLVVDTEGDVEPDKTVSPPLWFVDVDFTYRSNRGS